MTVGSGADAMMLAWLAAATVAASGPRDAPAPRPAARAAKAVPTPAGRDPTPSDLDGNLMDDIKTTSFPLNGWTYLASAEDAIVFYQFPIQRQAGLPRMSTRWELAKPRANTTGRFLSVQQVQEMDCIRGASHTVQHAVYKGHNLVGPIISEPATEQPWISPDPGSLEEAVFKKACAPP